MADLRGIIEYDYDSTGDDYPDRIWLAEGITEATAAGVIYDLTAEVERLSAIEAAGAAFLAEFEFSPDSWGGEVVERFRAVLGLGSGQVNASEGVSGA